MSHVCEMCPNGSSKSADVYCEADSCYLCTTCDREVHNANRLAQRHIRRPVLVEDVSEDLSAAEESKSGSVAHIEETSIATDEKSAYSDGIGSDPNMSSMSFEDNGDYDFCDFTNLGGKMPSLGLEDDTFFHPTKIYSKPISSELSWDTMMQKHLTNEIPDIEMETLTPPVSSFPSTCALADMETENVNKKDLVRRMHQSMESDNETEASNSLSSTKSEAKGSSAESTDSTCGTVRTASKVVDSFSLGDTVQSPEHRKKMRMEALARFRSKRANRSFAKRVRYECRKQLADSRPRVKGRFVKKSEMALYRKYGADYRNHMHELEPESPSTSGR